jgi:hypothetical protein
MRDGRHSAHAVCETRTLRLAFGQDPRSRDDADPSLPDHMVCADQDRNGRRFPAKPNRTAFGLSRDDKDPSAARAKREP